MGDRRDLNPRLSGTTIQCSNQLSYDRHIRIHGILQNNHFYINNTSLSTQTLFGAYIGLIKILLYFC